MKKNQINEDEVFLINPDYFVKVETFGSNNDKVVVVDDFYAYPDKVRQLALIYQARNQRIRGGNPAWRVNAFYVLDGMAWIFDPNHVTPIFSRSYGTMARRSNGR